jgi:hypothetical protein
MRLSPSTVAEAVAWAVIFVLVAAALVFAPVLGFPGLLILGLLTALVCASAELSDDVPTWSQSLFASRGPRPSTPEERAAEADASKLRLSPLRLGKRLGFVLIAAGLLGTAWRIWR